MDFATWMLERGEGLQYGLFFGAFGLFLLLESLFPRRKPAGHRRRRWPTNFAMTATNVVALGFVPTRPTMQSTAWARPVILPLAYSTTPGWVFTSTCIMPA
jgi:hypothetical protein